MQYSLKSLFIVTFMASLFCAVFFAVPDWLCVIILAIITLCLPGVLIGGIVYGRDRIRAFSIGAFTVACPSIFYLYNMGFLMSMNFGSSFTDETWPLKIGYVVFLAVMVFSGFITVGIRYFLSEKKEQSPFMEE